MVSEGVLFEFLGLQWTWQLIGTLIAGAVPAIATLYKLHERWTTREERRLQMLRDYLDKEERSISAKRKSILKSITATSQSYLTGREFDVGQELDHAIGHLSNGYPELAAAKLTEIEKRLEQNESLLRKRTEDLEKHRASVHVFIAALADQSKNTELGLEHIAKALQYDNTDLDAIKYQSVLLLGKGDFDRASQGFNRLKQYSNGNDNAGYRADAYLGLATAAMKGGMPDLGQALDHLKNALQNLNRLPASEQDAYTRAQVHRTRGTILADQSWQGYDRILAAQSYGSALGALEQIPLKRGKVDFEIADVRKALNMLDANSVTPDAQTLQ